MLKLDDQDCIRFAAGIIEASSVGEACRLFALYMEINFNARKIAVCIKGDQEYSAVYAKPCFSFTMPIFSFSRHMIRSTVNGLQVPLEKNQKIIGVIIVGDIFEANVVSSQVFSYLLKTLANKLDRATNNIKNSLEIGNIEYVELQRRELDTKNQLEKLKKFFARMSHEIRTPLNSIIGLSEVIQNSSDETEKSKCIGVISKSSHILLNLINDVLDLSKLSSRTIELEHIPFNLYDEVKSVYEMFLYQKKKGVELELTFQSDKEQNYIGDPGRFRQVMVNLVSNAIKFTETGRVEIFVKELYTGSLLFKVVDTGIGISYNNRSKIFEEFSQESSSTTRKFGGTGLGLSICKLIVEMMHGRIWVGNNEMDGKGSIFSFRINLDQYNNVLPISGEPKQKLTGVKRVMVVDDTPMNLFLMKKVFSKTPFQVSYYESGKDAIKAFKNDNFDLILMDLQMPEMSGQETTEVLRNIEQKKKRNQSTIYALTADVYASIDKLEKSGFDGVFTKPLDREKLFNVIESKV